MTTYDVSDPARVTTRAEFAAGLTLVRERAGLTVRELAKRTGLSASTVGGYLSGRHLPTAGQTHVLVAVLAACGVTDDDQVAAWRDALGRVRTATDRRLPRPPAPYRGLESFGPGDSAMFFGREDETNGILDRLRALAQDPGPSGGVLAVIGPSGSGKSSVLRAGVVAAIDRGGLGAGWSCALTVPGSDPLSGYGLAAARPDGSEHHVVVIDQFEEIFTSVPDQAEREAFLQQLAERPATTLLVLGMRADFYAAAAGEPLLLAALQHAQVLIGPMSTEHVRDAVVRPAEAAGGTVEPGLVELVLADLAPHDSTGRAHDAGGLPLLSHAMLATWERASGIHLTIADYRAAGGINGAVQRTAEDLFDSLGADGQALARRMFLRLVHLGDDVAVTRRRAARDELARLAPAGDDTATAMVDAFVERRLLTAYATSVEISHEALLTAWPRLREWVDTDRAGLRLHRQITEGANVWAEAGHDAGALPRGTLLETGAEWAADPDHRSELDRLEVAYVEAAVTQRDTESRVARRRTQRLRRLLVMVAVLAVAAGVLAFLALRSRSTAEADRVVAENARRDALARQVSVESNDLLSTDPALAQQLALTAYRLSPSANSTAALIDASSSPSISRLAGHPGPTPLAVSGDGHLVAVGDASDGSTRLYEPRAGRAARLLGVLPGSHDSAHHQLFALRFTPDGRVLATGGDVSDVVLWDVHDPARPVRLGSFAPRFAGAVQSIAISPDGGTLAVASIGTVSLELWNIADPAHPTRMPAPRGQPHFTSASAQDAVTIQTVAFSPDGSRLAAAGSGKWLREWPVATASTTTPLSITSPPTTSVATNAIAYSPSGSALVTVSGDGTIVYRRASDLSLIRSLPTSPSASAVFSAAFAPDGTELAVGSADGTLTQWSTSDDTVLATTAHPGPVTGIGFSADSSQIMTTAADGALWSWQSSGPTVAVNGAVFNVSFSADGRRMATFATRQGGTQLWNTGEPTSPVRTGSLIEAPASAGPASGTGALRPDGRQLALGTAQGNVAVWQVSASGAVVGAPRVIHMSDKLIEYVAYSPDGSVLTVSGDDNQAHLWDVRDPAHPRELSHVTSANFVFSVAYNSSGTLLATASADDHVRLYDVHDLAHPVLLRTLGGFSSYVYGVAFSPHSSLLAATGANTTTRLWDIRDPRRPVALADPLTGPTDYNQMLSFSDDGRLLAVASNDGDAWVYRMHGRNHPTLLGALRRLSDGDVLSVAFRPHTDVLAGTGRTGHMAVWTVDPPAYARAACDGGTPITRAEWAQYVPGAPYDPPCEGGGSR